MPGEKPPYILVGHWFGALLVMEYAHLYPQKTAGLLLADPHHPDQMKQKYELRKSIDNFRRFFHTAAAASHFQVHARGRLAVEHDGRAFRKQTTAGARMFFVSNGHLKALARELDAWDETAAQTRLIKDFGATPLLVLSAGRPQAAWVAEFQNLHQEMTRLSTHGSHRIVPGAEHLSIMTRRESGHSMSRAILELIRAQRGT